MVLKGLAKLIYGLRGWTFQPLPDYWTEKSVIIGFPHRQNMDTVMAFAGFARVDVKGHILIKDSLFFWPVSTVLRALGGIPVDRHAPGGLVQQIAGEFETRDHFILALVPEGTRKGVTRLKSGFWHIAKTANVPILCWYLDSETKETRWVGKVVPGDSLKEDLQTIAGLYEAAGFSIPLNP